MSEYDIDERRFVTISVTGYPIDPKHPGMPAGGRGPSTTWAVVDSANCFREVAIFRPKQGISGAHCKDEAEALARELNRAETACLAS